MNAKWGWIARTAMLVLFAVVGCRTPQPDLKPAKQPEVFNSPSEMANLGSYPKQAFNSGDDPSKRSGLDPSMGQRGMQPASFGGPTSGGMPGGGMPGGGLR